MYEEEHKKESKGFNELISKSGRLVPALLIALLFINIFNFYQLRSFVNAGDVQQTGSAALPNSATKSLPLLSNIIPKGIPKIYGNELGINFDDISSNNPQKADAIIKKIGMLDNNINLNDKDMKRYISIASQISCEYCCGADSIISPDGKAACGCAHSFAMRGLAKYLITKHPTEFTDDQILSEMAKLKVLFFPAQMSKKAGILQSKGIETNYINLGSNKYRGIEASASGSGSGMVGGC